MARKLNNTDGFIIHGWMVTDLGLTGGELFAYALVHQFSQSDAGRYLGGPGYLAAWMGCTDNTARKNLHALVKKGLIVNEDKTLNGVTFRNYRVNSVPLKNFETPSKILSTPLKKFEAENNNESNIYINNNPLTPKFDFLSSLLSLGVTEETAAAWMQVRKAKKGVNTKIAFDAVVAEVKKAGLPAEDCIRHAVENSWCGFRAEWMKSRERERKTSPSRRDAFADMMEVGRGLGLMGGQGYDEQ